MSQHRLLSIFGAIFLLVGATYLALLSRNALKTYDYIGISEQQRHSITVTGEGKVTGIPDIAKIQLGYSMEKKTVAEAQTDATTKMNAMIDKLKKDFKIEAKDIETTNYNIYPQYNWNDGRQTLRGYQVSENLNVKVRDLDKVSDILAAAGGLGLNQVGGLSFDIDDPESLKQEARVKAIEQAKEKAEALAKVAGVKLGRVVSFNESNNQSAPMYAAYGVAESAKMLDSSVPTPRIEAGSTEITINATVEYEIL